MGEKGEGKALQHGKGAIGHLEEFVEAAPVPFECDLAHAISVMFKRGPHAPMSTASHAGDVIFPLGVRCAAIVKEEWQRAGQDGLDMARLFRSHGDAQIQTVG